MKKVFRKCENDFTTKNLFYLDKNDSVYEYIVDDKLVGYGILREDKYNRIQIYIDEKYQNNHYGSELFKYILDLNNSIINVTVSESNIKMRRIITNNKGIEIGRNNGIITYSINNK